MTEIGGYEHGFPAEDSDDEDVCRICRFPEESGNPLRYPCLCRGSIKYVHQDCLHRWLNRKEDKKCEVCGRSYSFVPVYSENAPERLSCNDFMIGVLFRVSCYMKLIVPWVMVILLNTYCCSLHPWGQKAAADFQRDFWMSPNFASLLAGLLYILLIVCVMIIITIVRLEFGGLNFMRIPGGVNFFWNRLQHEVMQGLWKYTIILCDWFVLKLIYFLGPPRRLILVPPNVPLHEFGVLRKLLFFIDDDAFAVLAISLCVSIVFVLMPLSIGSIVLATVGGSNFSGNSCVILGYMMMLLIPFAYYGIFFTLRQNSIQTIVRWCLLGFHFIAVTLPCFLLVCSVKACKNLFFIKETFVFCLKVGVMPWIIGWWLKICTSPMFKTTNSQKFEFLFPCLIMLRWMVGFCCVMHVDAYRELIQEIIHKRAFSYLQDVTEPDYKITKLNLGYTLFVFGSHGVLLVIMFHLPIKAITLISPSFFPLQLWVTDESLQLVFVALGIYFNLMIHGIKWLIELTRPAIKLIVHNWIIIVSSWLQLSDFLLIGLRGDGFQRDDQNVRPLLPPRHPDDENPLVLLYTIAEGSMVSSYGSQNVEDDIEDQRDNRFMLRIALMFVLAALTIFLFSTAFMALPVLMGRVFFASISIIIRRFGLKHDDFCGFWIGCYILRAVYFGTCFASDHIQKGRINFLLEYVLIRIRNGLMFSIWISIIPGLLGLLIDLMIVIPYHVPLNESPVYFLIQDWLIGLVVLHVWTFMTMLTPIKWFATKAWREKLKRIRNTGINRLPLTWLLRDVIGSIISTLLTTLSIPYMFVKSFPFLGFSQTVNSTVERFIWPVLLALIVVWFVAKLTRDLVIYLHQLVFNERYLVGERVDNLTEDLEH